MKKNTLSFKLQDQPALVANAEIFHAGKGSQNSRMFRIFAATTVRSVADGVVTRDGTSEESRDNTERHAS